MRASFKFHHGVKNLTKKRRFVLYKMAFSGERNSFRSHCHFSFIESEYLKSADDDIENR